MADGGMTTTRLAPSHCPRCGKNLDAATAPFAPVRPQPGDVTVCFYCATVLEFTEDMGFKLANISALPLEVLAQVAEPPAQ